MQLCHNATAIMRSGSEAMPANAPRRAIAQHLRKGFTASFADSAICKSIMQRGRDGDIIRKRLVLIARANYDMRVLHSSAGYFVAPG